MVDELQSSLDTPVLLIIFNKIVETQRVFNAIRKQKPKQLFVAADGPRFTVLGEQQTCEAVRTWVLSHIDWECDVNTLFREQNVGCGRGPSEAITWFFQHVDEGIILEDDCLPCDTFFTFSSNLLELYRENHSISIISGNNFQRIQPMQIDTDYYFSIFPSSNGWATWKRSWNKYDYFITDWPKTNKKKFLSFLFNEKEYQLWWQKKYDWIHKERPNDIWDFQFHFHCMARQQYAIIPSANLITNIGYGPNATHSQDPDNYFANVPTYEIAQPFRHPTQIIRNYEADVFIQNMLFGREEVVTTFKKFKRIVKRVMRYSTK